MSNWTDEAYRCRALGHAWEPMAPDWEPRAGVALSLICTRCGTERRDSVVARTGELMGRRYVAGAGYQSSPGHPLPSRAEGRAWLAGKPWPGHRRRRAELRSVR